jgi:hypothetical protein
VLQVSVGVLTWQSTEWTGLHHGDQPGPKFKMLVTDVDSRPGGHVGNSQDKKLMEWLLGHSNSSCWYRGERFSCRWSGRRRRGTRPFLP